MGKVECREIIVSTLTRRGKGVEHDPIRIITEVFEKDGTKIAEHDPSPDLYTRIDLVNYAEWIQEGKWDATKQKGLINKWLDSIKI